MIFWKVVLESVLYILLMSGSMLRHVSLAEMISWHHLSLFVHVTSLDESFQSPPLGTLVPHQPVTWPSSWLLLEVSLWSAKEPMDRQASPELKRSTCLSTAKHHTLRTWTEDITTARTAICVDNDDDTCIVCPYFYLGVMCNFCCLKTLHDCSTTTVDFVFVSNSGVMMIVNVLCTKRRYAVLSSFEFLQFGSL